MIVLKPATLYGVHDFAKVTTPGGCGARLYLCRQPFAAGAMTASITVTRPSGQATVSNYQVLFAATPRMASCFPITPIHSFPSNARV